ncbi:uncharacterized protein LOC121596199 [Anopheles merus]|uniref:uncharacterized protein LOC121596199 n=1 Tax=Anopheles merus TaxID=30066 RepID=UPI001BE3D592|nr:uncharacterized protein LOC121596199 [Anopheles merus]
MSENVFVDIPNNEQTYNAQDCFAPRLPLVRLPNVPNLRITPIILPSENRPASTSTKLVACNDVYTPHDLRHISNDDQHKCCKCSTDEVHKLKQQLAVSEALNNKLEEELKYYKNVLEQKLEIVLKNSAYQREAFQEFVTVSRPREGLLPKTNFEFAPMQNDEELQNFDRQLGTDAEYKAKVVRYLQKQVDRSDVLNRLHSLIDLLFGKTFFSKFCWMGSYDKKNPKKPFNIYKNVINLFQIIGTNENIMPSTAFVKEFLQQKFKNSLKRIHVSDLKTTTSFKKVNVNNDD